MEPTLPPGRIIFVNRLAYGFPIPFIDSYIATWSRPARNSIIVLRNPIDNKKLVKRCIAIPGDKIRIEDGILYIDSDATLRIEVGNTPFFMLHGETVVPEKKFLVLGDNLDDSIDSRLFGFVQLDKITGSVIF
jgi:signal peptidase I